MRRWNGAVWGLVVWGLAGSVAEARGSYYRDRGHKVSLFLKGGVGDYTGALGTSTHAGPTWGVALGLQPLDSVGFEVGYDGAFNTASSGSADSALLRHGASGLVKLSLALADAVKPFVGLGVGASYIQVASSSGSSASGLLAEVPLVAGLEFNAQALTAGLRINYRVLVQQQIYQTRNTPSGFFDVGATLGLRF